jgi:hypothetical protein
VTLQLDKQKQEKMKLLIGIINPSDTLNLLMEIVKKDLSCALQKLSGFNVTIQFFDKIPSKNALKKLSVDGFPIVIFIQEVAGGKALEWRCYDSLHASMQKGKRMYLKNAILEIDAHKLADIFWNILTGQEGIFYRFFFCRNIYNSCLLIFFRSYSSFFSSQNRTSFLLFNTCFEQWNKYNFCIMNIECIQKNSFLSIRKQKK